MVSKSDWFVHYTWLLHVEKPLTNSSPLINHGVTFSRRSGIWFYLLPFSDVLLLFPWTTRPTTMKHLETNTARNGINGRDMFSRKFVCPCGEGELVASHASLDRSHDRYIPSSGNTLPLWIYPPLLVTSGGHRWRLQICSLHSHPTYYWHLVVATETLTVDKRAVRILLEFYAIVANNDISQSGCFIIYTINLICIW